MQMHCKKWWFGGWFVLHVLYLLGGSTSLLQQALALDALTELGFKDGWLSRAASFLILGQTHRFEMLQTEGHDHCKATTLVKHTVVQHSQHQSWSHCEDLSHKILDRTLLKKRGDALVCLFVCFWPLRSFWPPIFSTSEGTCGLRSYFGSCSQELRHIETLCLGSQLLIRTAVQRSCSRMFFFFLEAQAPQVLRCVSNSALLASSMLTVEPRADFKITSITSFARGWQMGFRDCESFLRGGRAELVVVCANM